MESFEAEISSVPEPSKNVETENLERKILADTNTGDCDTNVTYTFDGETLTISGSGTMTDYSNAFDVPWNDYKDSIKSVEIKDGVQSIGDMAFYYCSSLESVTIPNSVTSIGDVAFAYCSSLTSVIIGNGVQSIGDMAFYYCSSLESVTIPNSVTSIGDVAFAYCSSLTSVIIGNGVQSIGYFAFSNCNSLKSITISEGNVDYKSEDGILFSKDGANLIQYPAGKTDTSYSIPNSVQLIGDSAFQYCTSLTSVTIPDSVTSIGDSAFRQCNILESVTIPSTVESIGNNAFYQCSSLESVTIPGTVKSIGINAFAYCSSLSSITILNSVQSIGDSAFLDCSSLSSVTYNGISNPTNSTSVFSGCNKLISVDVPTNYEGNTFCGIKVNKIINPDNPDKPGNQDTGDCGENVTYTFDGETLTISGSGAMSNYSSGSAPWYDYKDSIKSVEIKDGVQSIGSNAFSDCSSLISVTIGSGVKYIGGYAFSGCSSLISVTYNGIFEKHIIDSAFFGCNILEVVVPTNYVGDTFCGMSVNKIGKPGIDTGNCGDNVTYTFDGETLTISGSGAMSRYSSGGPWYDYKDSIKNVVIEDGVQSIGEYAFSDCSSLTSVTIGNGVTSIGYAMFSNCSSLTSVSIPDSVTSIGDYAFSNCSSLTSVSIQNSVKTIGHSAFSSCSSLTSITIPGSVQSIGNRAFSDCSSLTSITYNGTSEPEISDSAFEGCNIESVNVPNNYEGETFCGKPVNKTINPDKPVDPENPGKPSKPGKSKAGVIAGSVVAAVVVVAAIVVTIVMYVKKLGCFGRVMDSISAASAASV